VKKTLVEAAVDYLRFSPDDRALDDQQSHKPAEWMPAVNWLHDAGLGLHFLERVKCAGATQVIPAPVLTRLEDTLASNHERVALMLRQFSLINRAFHDAEVKYAAIKGFALVPQFCPDPGLRHQSDIDYLVEEQSLASAQRVLENAGYYLALQSKREFMFSWPGARKPRNSEEQYSASTAHTVELQLALCDTVEHDVLLAEKKFSAELTVVQHWQGLDFPVLCEEEAFLLQVRHAFLHLMNYWVRLSWLFEIGYFLHRRAGDSSFWDRLERHVGNEPLLREIVALISSLAANFFSAPVPPVIAAWALDLRPAVRVWMENYARPWMFAKAPGHEFRVLPVDKFVLFLHQQYMTDTRSQKQFSRVWLLHPSRLSRVMRSFKNQPRMMLSGHVRRRAIFHLTTGARFLLEVPRWRRLNRTASLSAAK
jgi:hypothetical protein